MPIFIVYSNTNILGYYASSVLADNYAEKARILYNTEIRVKRGYLEM
jgi:hypothetical protein